MNTVSGLRMQSTTLSAIKTERADADSDDGHSAESAVVLASTQQIDKNTSVTTLLLSNTNNGLPSMSLEDVLERSGVAEDSEVVLETQIQAGAQSGQEAIEALESAEAVVIEVETTNNVQTVTVRAADIDTVYGNASLQSEGMAFPDSSSCNVLLLKNGWAYTDLLSSPLELPVGPADGQSDAVWAVWRSAEDGAHEILDSVSGLWCRLSGQVIDTSPKSAEDVAGTISFHTASVGLLSTSTSTTTLQLSSQGVFSNTTTSLVNSNGLIPDVSYALHKVKSAAGISGGFTGTASVDGLNSAVVNNHTKLAELAGDMFGAFQVLEDGLTVELHYADGRVERKLYLQPRDDQHTLNVGGQCYYRQGGSSDDLLGDLMLMLGNKGESNTRGKWLKELVEALRKSSAAAKVQAAAFQEKPLAEPSITTLPEIHIQQSHEKLTRT